MGRQTAHGLAFLAEDRPAEAFEQLDSALRIVTVRNWVVLASAFLTLLAFVVFACFYRAPLKVDGRGIILADYPGTDDPLLHVTAPASGRVTRVYKKIGETLRRGELLAEIDQKELLDELEKVEAEVARLREEHRRLLAFDENEARIRQGAFDQLQRALDTNLDLDSNRYRTHLKILEGDRVLRARSMLSFIDQLKEQADADAVQSDMGNTRARQKELNYQREEDRAKREREKLKRELAIEAAETDRTILLKRIERDTEARSDDDGKIVDLMVTEHAQVEKGEPIALLTPPLPKEPPLEAIVFVPAGLGKKVDRGHEVELSPDTIRRQEHGFIRGKVLSVSEIPATDMAMLAELKHKNLVNSFVEEYRGQVLLCLHVELPEARGPARPGRKNRLDWSSSTGAEQTVSTGTLCSAAIVVERRPLITLAIPWLRQLAGYY